MTEPIEQEIDLTTLWRGVQRSLPWILGASALAGAGTYFWSDSQPRVYSASSTLISSGNAASPTDSIIGNSTVRAGALPEGAVAQAMQSTSVLVPLINALKTDNAIPAEEKARLSASLEKELRHQQLETVTLTSRIEQYSGGSGIYTINARARTPEAAAQVANLASTSLLNWDRGRALENIRRAEAGFKSQLAQIEQQLKEAPAGLERQTLIAKRANVQTSLTQIGIMENSATGSLSLLSNAVAPLQADAPKPVRNAVLVTLLSLLLGSGIAALRTVLDRTVRSEDDLIGVGLPTLATVPKIKQKDVLLSGIVKAARQAGLYESIGFLRVNLLGAIQGKQHPVVMITSTAPGEGKSSVTASLADGMAASGQRVLIIDADLRRGTQEAVWKKANESGEWKQLVGEVGVRSTREGTRPARNTREALSQPDNVQVLQVEKNVDMLPAGPGLQDTLAILNQSDIASALALWRTQYDVVLIDSAPLLALADGLVLGKHADAVVMVSEYGNTHLQAVKSALRRADRAGLNVIGAVINKADARQGNSYGYNYSYSHQ